MDSKRFLLSGVLALLAALLPSLCLQAVPARQSLNGTWLLSFWPQGLTPVLSPGQMDGLKAQQIPARVPGNVEIDMEAAGLIPDPMVGNNINGLRPYEGYQWCYSRQFDAPELQSGQRAELFFGGIDCIAEVWLNDVHVGSADNMFIEQVYDVTDALRSGAPNTLKVIIRSAVMEAQQYLLGGFSLGAFAADEAVFIRKAPHMYGWDILPRLVSAGLWRDVELRIAGPVRITDVCWMTIDLDLEKKTAEVFADLQMKIPFDRLDKTRAVFTLQRGARTVCSDTLPVISHALRDKMRLENVDFWWPRGYGEPALYEASVQLLDENGAVLDRDSRRIGVRTVGLDRTEITTPEEPGRFCFQVNGEPVFIKGTNWVPVDALHSRDAAQMRDAVGLAVDLNCNMIRCWGGNVYEDHLFYDLCDENGILVWQDFAMGCTFYPQRREFAERIEREIRSVVLKLRNHASIALWSGNNEDDASLLWSLSALRIDPNRDVISRQVIPQVVYEFDLTRPYLPSSPYYSQRTYELGSRDENLPEAHLWGPRGYYKAPFYTQAACQFVSEIGYHGCPNRSSLEKMFHKEYLYPWVEGTDHQWNDEWLTKSVRIHPLSAKTAGRNNYMTNQVSLLFGGIPDELDDFIVGSQIVQAEAMKYFIEKWRSEKFARAGIIWWNVRDGWPVVSDAVVDYYGTKKLAYHFIKNVQHDVCVVVNDAVQGACPLVAVNDTRQGASGTVTVTDIASGKQLYTGSFQVGPNDKARIASLPELPGRGMLLVSYEVGGRSYKNHYLYGHPPFDLKQYRRWLEKTGIYPADYGV